MPLGIVAERDSLGRSKSEYVFLKKDFSGSTAAVSYYLSDDLGMVSVITDSLGNIKQDEDYCLWEGELKAFSPLVRSLIKCRPQHLYQFELDHSGISSLRCTPPPAKLEMGACL